MASEMSPTVWRDVIATWARADGSDRPLDNSEAFDYDRRHLVAVTTECGMALSSQQVDAAFRVLRQRSFMGGNFTLDARAIVRALTEATR